MKKKAKKGNAKPVKLTPEIMTLMALQIKYRDSCSDLSFDEWLKSPKNEVLEKSCIKAHPPSDSGKVWS